MDSRELECVQNYKAGLPNVRKNSNRIVNCWHGKECHLAPLQAGAWRQKALLAHCGVPLRVVIGDASEGIAASIMIPLEGLCFHARDAAK